MYLYLFIFWICTNRIFNGDINLLVKCSESVATLRHTILCTYEIPVWVNGYDLYVDAYTKIINEKHVTNVLSDIRTNQCNEKKKIKYYCCLIHIKEDIWFKNRKSFSEIHRMFKLLDGNYQRSSRSVLPTWFIPNYGFPKEKSFISSTSNTLDGSKLLAPVKTN